jgi:DNA helicase IV
MQWRLLLRRGPLRSFTIVGDIAQAASAAASPDWRAALQPLLSGSPEGDRWRLEELTVNYRTPSQIAASAESMAIAHGLPVTPSRAVRESEWPITVVADVVEAVELERSLAVGGTVAVIAPDSLIDGVETLLTERFGAAVGRGAGGLVSEVSIVTPQDAKGLEFDAVIVVDPAAIVAASERGAGALYVSMTRATQRLTLVSSGPLPAGIILPAAR